MKRMSEVFELPVSYMDLAYLTSQNEDGSMTFAENKRCTHAARAINHVDALADALDDAIGLLSCSASMRCVGEEKLLAVLNAYRGAK